jgi:hypothetical protein
MCPVRPKGRFSIGLATFILIFSPLHGRKAQWAAKQALSGQAVDFYDVHSLQPTVYLLFTLLSKPVSLCPAASSAEKILGL